MTVVSGSDRSGGSGRNAASTRIRESAVLTTMRLSSRTASSPAQCTSSSASTIGRVSDAAVSSSTTASNMRSWPITGAAASILAGERVALNFLGRLSGVATLTARYVQAVEGTGARILDTRKTTPGLRELEKAAVRAGGGVSHRNGLYDAILVKENHAALAGGVGEATRLALARAPAGERARPRRRAAGAARARRRR